MTCRCGLRMINADWCSGGHYGMSWDSVHPQHDADDPEPFCPLCRDEQRIKNRRLRELLEER